MSANDSKVIWQCKRPEIPSIIFKKKKTKELILPNINAYYKAIAQRHCGIGESVRRSMEYNRAKISTYNNVVNQSTKGAKATKLRQ